MKLNDIHNSITNFIDENQGASYGSIAANFQLWDALCGVNGYSAKALEELLNDGQLIQVVDNPNLGTYKFMLPY